MNSIRSSRPDERDWIDINRVIRRRVRSCRHDRRWSGIEFKLAQDSALPAVFFSPLRMLVQLPANAEP